ncbi:hypothetical protein [Vibrio sp. EA2]|uniref:hypothetical protein n=1 Tax=Vibrio sp. EA2 TaxID=3079860 RepID=UPI0029494D27|nr:hypothetical protein [Vibrio sp. EA2]MDV6254439.1 hypothetical protein [Vibrio sp. EA2]
MIEKLLKDGWGYHDSESERLALELESVSLSEVQDEHVTPLLTLISHTIGEHLNQWSRARELSEHVFGTLGEGNRTSHQWALVAVLRYMDFAMEEAQAAELESALNIEGNALAAFITVKLMLAKALFSSNRFDEGLPIFKKVTALSSTQKEGSGSERVVAISCNNIANDLLKLEDRTPIQDSIMLSAGEYALAAWKKCGNWVNEERALYLLQLIQNTLGDTEKSLGYADYALEIIKNEGPEPVDEAFIRLEKAKTYKRIGDSDNYELEITLADNLAQLWDDASLQSWYESEKSKLDLISA